MASESSVQRSIWLASAALAGVVLFRANSGKAWLGMGPPRRLTDGSVVLPGARPIALGLALVSGAPVAGQGDLLGWRTITITPDMVGGQVAVFLSVECKREKGGRASEDQLHWLGAVQRAGGIAGIANSPDAAKKIITEWRPARLQGA